MIWSSCSRCLSYLGDASFIADKASCNDDCLHQENSKEIILRSNFDLGDVSDVKFCNHNISFNSKNLQSLVESSIERVI